jgi:hypothetical protein
MKTRLFRLKSKYRFSSLALAIIILFNLLFLHPAEVNSFSVKDIIDVGKKILLATGKFALDEAGYRVLGSSYRYFKPAIDTLVKEIQTFFPEFLSTSNDEKAEYLAENAANLLETDSELQKILINGFLKLEKGQKKILEELQTIKSTSHNTYLNTQQILNILKNFSPDIITPYSGLTPIDDPYGIIRFEYLTHLDAPQKFKNQNTYGYRMGSWKDGSVSVWDSLTKDIGIAVYVTQLKGPFPNKNWKVYSEYRIDTNKEKFEGKVRSRQELKVGTQSIYYELEHKELALNHYLIERIDASGGFQFVMTANVLGKKTWNKYNETLRNAFYRAKWSPYNARKFFEK